jgi:SAM-dependent methyltransferase
MSKDDLTLQFYAANAATYAARDRLLPARMLDRFLAELPPDGRILELGCGGGQDAAYMLSRGFTVVPTDGSPELAAEAAQRLGLQVQVMRFDELDAVSDYEGVWASASLLHVPRPALTPILRLVHRALKADGRFWSSYKTGKAEGRDRFGRYYNRPGAHTLQSQYEKAGAWRQLRITKTSGHGYNGEDTDWLWVEATR